MSGEKTRERDEPRVHGQTVREYAGVHAALAEGFALDAVLESAGIPLDAWSALDAAWADALAEDAAAGGALGEAFDRALLEMQRRYRRAIPPLDDDLGAWLRFARAWGRAEDPDAFLRERGLEPSDALRLHRHWSERLAAEPALRDKAAAVLADDDAPPPHVPRPAPPELRAPLRRGTGTQRLVSPSQPPRGVPSVLAELPKDEREIALPTLKGSNTGAALVDAMRSVLGPALLLQAQRAPIPDAQSAESSPFDSVRLPEDFEVPPPESLVPRSVSDELTLAQYASLRAELEARPDEERAIFAKYGLEDAEKRARIDEAWQARLGGETETFAEWRVLYKHFSEHWERVARREAEGAQADATREAASE